MKVTPIMPAPKIHETPSARQAAYIARKKKAGHSRLSLMVPEELKEQIKQYVARLMKKHSPKGNTK